MWLHSTFYSVVAQNACATERAAERKWQGAFFVYLSLAVGAACLCPTARAQVGDWEWVDGSSTVPVTTCKQDPFGNSCAQPGVYGVLGTPAATNTPGGRQSMANWTDSIGNMWLFGGFGVDADGKGGYLNDLWEFDPITQRWVWMSGSSSLSGDAEPGVYGTLGEPAAGNVPGGRQAMANWADSSGNLWLFGGFGTDSTGTNNGPLNDLWRFNPTSSTWTWMAGSSTIGSTGGRDGVYGVLGLPAASNLPGSRMLAVSWTDATGNFWLFGGIGVDSVGNNDYLNDLWKYNPSTGEWVWMSGSSTVGSAGGQLGVYGTLGVPAAANVPGSRSAPATWVDLSGNLWLFGGFGVDSTGALGGLNDLWKFNPSTQLWTWMGGNNTAGSLQGQLGVYGTLGVPAAANIPSARSAPVSWPDLGGNLWLFGGSGYGPQQGHTVVYTSLNDLWQFNPSSNEWAWMAGSATAGSNCYTGDAALVEFCGQPGVYGTLGAPGAQNIPGGRADAVAWIDRRGYLWLFGGGGFDSTGAGGDLNDLWNYEPSISVAQPTATPTFAPAQGTFTAAQSVTIEDSNSNATIYYTADGTTPTTSSAVYGSALNVTSTETIQAIAVATGYTSSAVASAAYTINIPPPTFTLAVSSSKLNLQSGAQGTVTVTVNPQNGFSSAVTFACSGLSSGATCAFSPASITPPGTTTTQLTVTAETLTASQQRGPRPFFPEVTFALAVCLVGWRKRRGLQLGLLVLALSGLGMLSGCGGGGSSCSLAVPASKPSTITVTATSGSVQQTATFALYVTPTAQCN